MRDINTDTVTLTLTLPKPKGELEQVLLALTLQAKNIGNTGLYLVRQVYSAYAYDKEAQVSRLKPELHPSQTDVMAHYNAQITRINQKREAKYPAQLEKAIQAQKAEKDLPKLKLITLLEPTMDNLSGTILDSTVLDNAVREWKNSQGVSVYGRLPGAMAQQVVATLKDNFTGFFKTSKAFNAGAKDMTGRPRMPGYRDKHDRAVIEIPLAQVHNGNLPDLKRKPIPEDYLETVTLSPELLKVFSRFNLNELIDKACQKRGWTDFAPQHLRIVPLLRGVKMEVVVRVKNAYTETSFLAKINTAHGKELSELKTSKERDKWLLNHLQSLPFEQLPRIAGIDLGVSNLATVAYSTGHKAEIHSGGRFDAKVGALNDAIDAFIAKNSTVRAKELQGLKNALREKGEKLSKSDHHELNSLLKVVYSHPKYLKLAQDKQNWMSSFLHTLSHNIVQRCVDKHIDVIVIGQNKGWKQEINHGRKENRRFAQIAHATLIQLMTYKAEHAGIAVVTTEESYTSKTSFVNGDTLEVYEDVRKTVDSDTPRPVKSGKRSPSDRNRFVHKNREDRWHVVHADVNGAFNIIRKVFRHFRYHLKLTLKYTLFRLSPRLGVVPIRL